MSDIIEIACDEQGRYSIFRNGVLLVHNLDYELIIRCGNELKNLINDHMGASRIDSEAAVPSTTDAASRKLSPGRALVLAPHIDIIWDMIDRDPRTTARSIERRLRGLGIKFASVTAVTNLARRHGLKLAA